MRLSRRNFLHLAGGAAALSVLPRIASAQAYPSRPVHVVVPFAAGSGTDIVARLIGQLLSERLGQQFVIENRPGGGTNIGTESVIRAPADGYTVLMVTPANTVNATLYDKLNFNFIRDTTPVAGIFRAPFVMDVHPSFPAKTLPEFLAYAKANSGKMNMASAGNGTGSHMSGELFKIMSGINMQHVPYRGGGPALLDLIGGQVQVYFASMPETIGYIKSGKVQPLAVTSATRAEALPDIPTVGDFLPGYQSSVWYGVSAPKNAPVEVVNKLNAEINAALVDPKIKAKLAELSGAGLLGSPADFGKHLTDETEKWSKVVRAANIKPE
jgi:tripartite-type tricarboxylate transporter receptor subunit TctC